MLINLKKNFTIVCRGSWLSLAQAELFKEKVKDIFPDVSLNVLIKETAGDKNQLMPLHLVEGKDFFTREIQDALLNGDADFAVHSMKDVSSEAFFQHGHFAIIDRDTLNDVAIFNSNIVEKIARGDSIVIGTSSPRRSNMASEFLQKALPKFGNGHPSIIAKPIRGNVDGRLQKLNDGLFDGIILATAGLNRLLNYEPAVQTVSSLLANKKIMVLPLFECPPAAGQGAIVAETTATNKDALQILEAIKNSKFGKAVKKERKYAQRHGYGCSQQFGVFHLDLNDVSFTYAAGKDAENEFTEWDFDGSLPAVSQKVFVASKYMKEFFEYSFYNDVAIEANEKIIFVASHAAVHSSAIQQAISSKIVWAAGTHTWLKLAEQNIWVQGCADGLGLEWVLNLMNSPLINIAKRDVTILTNTSSANDWIKDGWRATGSYGIKPVFDQGIAEKIAGSEILFWTSFQQYLLYRDYINPLSKHCCPAGKTAVLLQREGISPAVFPGIKSFNEWVNNPTIVTSEG